MVQIANDTWTGTDFFGLAGGLGGPLGSPSPSLGISNTTNSRWINNKSASIATEPLSFYALSSVLTVVPEPSGAALILMSAFGIGRRRLS